MAFDAEPRRSLGIAELPPTGFFCTHRDAAAVEGDLARIQRQLDREQGVYRTLMVGGRPASAKVAVRNIKRFRRALNDGRRHLHFLATGAIQ